MRNAKIFILDSEGNELTLKMVMRIFDMLYGRVYDYYHDYGCHTLKAFVDKRTEMTSSNHNMIMYTHPNTGVEYTSVEAGAFLGLHKNTFLKRAREYGEQHPLTWTAGRLTEADLRKYNIKSNGNHNRAKEVPFDKEIQCVQLIDGYSTNCKYYHECQWYRIEEGRHHQRCKLDGLCFVAEKIRRKPLLSSGGYVSIPRRI